MKSNDTIVSNIFTQLETLSHPQNALLSRAKFHIYNCHCDNVRATLSFIPMQVEYCCLTPPHSKDCQTLCECAFNDFSSLLFYGYKSVQQSAYSTIYTLMHLVKTDAQDCSQSLGFCCFSFYFPLV